MNRYESPAEYVKPLKGDIAKRPPRRCARQWIFTVLGISFLLSHAFPSAVDAHDRIVPSTPQLAAIRNLSETYPCAMLGLLRIMYYGEDGFGQENGESVIYVNAWPSSTDIARVVDSLLGGDTQSLARALEWSIYAEHPVRFALYWKTSNAEPAIHLIHFRAELLDGDGGHLPLTGMLESEVTVQLSHDAVTIVGSGDDCTLLKNRTARPTRCTQTAAILPVLHVSSDLSALVPFFADPVQFKFVH